MTPQQFVDKWRPVALSERSAAQSHFRDLCLLFDHPDPISADPVGEWFTFEKGVPKSGGGDGFADVWKRSHFAWEYKKKRRNLDEALGQLARYALGLESPPLHIVCDTDRFLIVTAWTNSVPRTYEITLPEILDPTKRGWLESAFHKPDRLRPGGLRADLTEEAANKFSSIATRLIAKGNTPKEVAHFVNRLVFLYFAEDINILAKGEFRGLLREAMLSPRESKSLLSEFFRVLQKGGRYGSQKLPYVNGSLFDGGEALDLDETDIALLVAAGSADWAHIDPTIFGTLFERFLDPTKRSQIGAHYTDAEKIMKIIDPVIVRPLSEEWDGVRERIEALTDKARRKGPRAKEWREAEETRSVFVEKLKNISILDPACGSGNFLYLALHAVKDLELRVNQDCEVLDLPPRLPSVGPEVLRGIEINPLAAELARTAIWIGDIQWSIRNGFRSRPEPILQKLDSIECRDALITESGEKADWPKADVIVGNPPFLGGSKFLRAFGPEYTSKLRGAYKGSVSPAQDLVSYWFHKAADYMHKGGLVRAGLVATNTIRQHSHREIMNKVCAAGDIYSAWSDQPWVNDGANVGVSIVCFGRDASRADLDGCAIEAIGADLRPVAKLIEDRAQEIVAPLSENLNISFQGSQKIGAFDIPGSLARKWLKNKNPNKLPNSAVLRPLWNGLDITRGHRDVWVVDFGTEMGEEEASLFQKPFEYLVEHVKDERLKNGRASYRKYWWRHGEPRISMREQLSGLDRYIAISEKSKHFYFVFVPGNVLPDKRLIVVARSDDFTFGVLSSKFHEAWSKRYGSTLEDRPCYTPTTCFATYPFPQAPEATAERVSRAANNLDRMRVNWLDGDATPEGLVGLGRPNHNMTDLYNEQPTWLRTAHAELNRAVAAAYGWPEDISVDDAMTRLVELNVSRAKKLSDVRTSAPLPVPLPLSRNRVRKSGARRLEVLDAVANATVILAPSHLASVSGEVGAADAVVDAHLGATEA